VIVEVSAIDSKRLRLSPAEPREYTDEDVHVVERALRRGHLSVVFGRETVRFEKAFARTMGATNAVAVSSGTAALLLALESADVGIGDEVIVPAYSFPGTALTVVRTLGLPCFADIEPDTWNVSAATIAAQIKPCTKAVVVVHNFGNPADMRPIRALCDQHGLYLVEDCAQAAGASIGERMVGTFADAGCFSFNEIKNMTTGEGGAILLRDRDAAKRARVLRLYGTAAGVAEEVGMKCAMTEMEAALGLSQLERLQQGNQHRERVAALLCDELAEVPGVAVQKAPDGATHVYSRFVIRVDADRAGLDRDELSVRLREHHLFAEPIGATPVYRQPAFIALASGNPGSGFARSYVQIYADDPRLTGWPALEMPHAEMFCREHLGFTLLDTTPEADARAFGQTVTDIVGGVG
jgi:perosamine synthetase